MRDHHEAWLSAHPRRSKEWLSAMLADGFNVHHLDGDHGNNDPANLILIDSVDHMRLHNRSLKPLYRVGKRWVDEEEMAADKRRRMDVGAKAYAKKQATGRKWEWIAAEVSGAGSGISGTAVAGMAKEHAIANGKPWPLRHEVGKAPWRSGLAERRLAFGRRAYEERAKTGKTWVQITKEFAQEAQQADLLCDWHAGQFARQFAMHAKADWPLPGRR